jgi:hypothetical protein
MELLGDSPGDRLVVGDAGDQGLLAAQIEEHGEGAAAGAVERWCDSPAAPAAGPGRRVMRTAGTGLGLPLGLPGQGSKGSGSGGARRAVEGWQRWLAMHRRLRRPHPLRQGGANHPCP